MRASISPQFLIGRPPEKSGSVATDLLGVPWMDSYEWKEVESAVLTVTVVQPAHDMRAVRDFCNQISKMADVEAVMVEELDGGVQHVTTFLSSRSRELEAEIYKVEAAVIGNHPNVVLDFHVRVAPRDDTGAMQLPDGPYYLLTWRAA